MNARHATSCLLIFGSLLITSPLAFSDSKPSFTATPLSKALLVRGSAGDLHYYEVGTCESKDPSGNWCINGLTFNRPGWKPNEAPDGVVMDGVNAPYDRSGIGLVPARDKVAQVSFNIPQGAKWFNGFVGFEEGETKQCGVGEDKGGNVTVLIKLDGQEVRRFNLRGKSGPAQDLVSRPINVSGSHRLNFVVDANGDNYCDSVFIAGAQFTP